MMIAENGLDRNANLNYFSLNYELKYIFNNFNIRQFNRMHHF
jgi:hypothetical protein